VISSPLDRRGFSLFFLVARNPDGAERKVRLSIEAYLEIVAATNFKQRTRKMLEYYHADRLHFAVAGTPNRLEYDQGFFVKLGDGAADVKPIAHLYKSQVYQLAEHLGVPEEIRRRPPTTDTYSLPQGQDEFYFSLPYDRMDLCLWGRTTPSTSATSPRRSGSRASRSNSCMPTSTSSDRPRATSICRRCWWERCRRSRRKPKVERTEGRKTGTRPGRQQGHRTGGAGVRKGMIAWSN